MEKFAEPTTAKTAADLNRDNEKYWGGTGGIGPSKSAPEPERHHVPVKVWGADEVSPTQSDPPDARSDNLLDREHGGIPGIEPLAQDEEKTTHVGEYKVVPGKTPGRHVVIGKGHEKDFPTHAQAVQHALSLHREVKKPKDEADAEPKRVDWGEESRKSQHDPKAPHQSFSKYQSGQELAKEKKAEKPKDELVEGSEAAPVEDNFNTEQIKRAAKTGAVVGHHIAEGEPEKIF